MAMAAREDAAIQPGTQFLSSGQVLHFVLEHGDAGIIAPEQRRTYDSIVRSNVGRSMSASGLTDAQVQQILSKSHLPQDEIEHIWELTTTLKVEGLPDGLWTPLEVYVALHFLQAQERLNLNQVYAQFAGPFEPVEKKKVARRASYAQARAASLSMTDLDNPVAQESGSSRNQPRADRRQSSSASIPLRHTHSDASASAGASARAQHIHRHTDWASSDHDSTSVSQAGLEALDEIQEQAHDIDRDDINLLRESSVRTNTADRAQRLATLIKARCPESAILPVIEPPQPRVRDASTLDRHQAHEVLVRKHREDPSYKDPTVGFSKLLKSKQSKQKASNTHNWIFSSEEKSLALKESVESGWVGVAEVLLDMGADVNVLTESAKSKVMRRKSTTTRTTNYILTAASTNNVEMVVLLASRRVSLTSLAEALDKAVKQNLPKVVEVLLQYEADPNAMAGATFKAAVNSQKPIIVRLLLRARVQVSKVHLTASLPGAASQGQAEIVSLLVTYGADVNDDRASALRISVQSQRIDIVLAIMKGKPSGEAVSSAFEGAFLVDSSIALHEMYLLFEILLCGGARGDCVAETLVRVVRASHRSIAKLLIMHGASLHFRRAEALRIAIIAGDVDLLTTLLVGDLHPDCATELFDDIPRPFIRDQTYKIMSVLIFKGASGIPLDKALVVAVQQKLVVIVELLLNHKASVDYNDAQALQIAASAGDLKVFGLLLSKGRPRPESMQYVLPQVPPYPQRLRYDMTKLTVDAAGSAGIPTSILDVALMEAVDLASQLVDLDLVKFVLFAGANVNCLNGRCFQLATNRGSMELLELLVADKPQPASLSLAVPEAMRLQHPTDRRKAIATFVDHGAQGPTISQALIDSLGEHPIDESLAMLLLTRASVDYRGGQSLVKAVQYTTERIVSSIIEIGKPNRQSLLAALLIALEPSVKNRSAKLQLLLQGGIDQKDLDKLLVQEINNGQSCDMTIVRILLDRGASCDHDAGKALELAIRSTNTVLLEDLLMSKPHHETLEKMLPIAMEGTGIETKYQLTRLLLHGGAKGDQVSQSLIQAICTPLECDLRLVKLLIQSRARIDYSDGFAIRHAVSAPLHVDLLRVLVDGRGAKKILASLVPLAMAHEQVVRLPLLQILLSSGARGSQVDAALVDAVTEGPTSQPTIDMLLTHNASIDHRDGQAIRQAAAQGYSSILQILLDQDPNPAHLPEALRQAMQIQTGSICPLRLQSVRLLTRPGVNNSATVHRALIQAVGEKDHDLIEHLLKSGGDPNFDNGTSVIVASKQADVKALMLLAKAQPTPKTYSDAFTAIHNSETYYQFGHDLLLRIYQILLDGGASGPSVDQTFLNAMASPESSANKFVALVLTCRCPSLNVDFEAGQSLRIAVQINALDIVKDLLDRGPNEPTSSQAFMAIFESDADEPSLMKMAELFFYHSGGTNHRYFGKDDTSTSPLYQVLHHHADKPRLLQYLLDNGCPADSHFGWQFTPDHGVEQVSALLWLLCQADDQNRTDTRTVKILVDQGADPNFRSLGSGNSPLIIAAASSQPNLVLQLLEAHALPDTEDNIHGTPLYYATRAGNLGSMTYLLDYGANPDDEALHAAARSLNRSATDLLLKRGATIDWPGIISCQHRTPLGDLCRRAETGSNPAQLKATLETLARAKPDLQKLAGRKSLVILALDNSSPFSMTKALLAAFPTLRESLNEDFNIYRRSGNLCYSPTMYARHFKCRQSPLYRLLDSEHACCDLNGCPVARLEELLRAFGCRDRFWDAKAGANQPVGACGFPQDILDARQEAKVLRKQQAEQAHLDAEERARHDAKQVTLEEDAAAERRRERELLAVISKGKRAEAAAEERRLTAIEAGRRAEAREEARQLEAVEAAERAKRDRERRAFSEHLQRTRTIATDEEERAKRQSDRRAKALIAETRIKKGLIKEQKGLIESATEMVRETRYAGVGGQQAGRILGEIKDGQNLLM